MAAHQPLLSDPVDLDDGELFDAGNSPVDVRTMGFESKPSHSHAPSFHGTSFVSHELQQHQQQQHGQELFPAAVGYASSLDDVREYSLSYAGAPPNVELEMRQIGISASNDAELGHISHLRLDSPGASSSDTSSLLPSTLGVQPIVLVSALKPPGGGRKKLGQRVSWTDELGLPLVEVSTVPRSWDRKPMLSEIMQRKYERERQRVYAICCGAFICVFIGVVAFITVVLRLLLP